MGKHEVIIKLLIGLSVALLFLMPTSFNQISLFFGIATEEDPCENIEEWCIRKNPDCVNVCDFANEYIIEYRTIASTKGEYKKELNENKRPYLFLDRNNAFFEPKIYYLKNGIALKYAITGYGGFRDKIFYNEIDSSIRDRFICENITYDDFGLRCKNNISEIRFLYYNNSFTTEFARDLAKKDCNEDSKLAKESYETRTGVWWYGIYSGYIFFKKLVSKEIMFWVSLSVSILALLVSGYTLRQLRRGKE
ncbi:MAG: hypothetical protein ACOC5T_08560 [Elusimicrobiota bacterium]